MHVAHDFKAEHEWMTPHISFPSTAEKGLRTVASHRPSRDSGGFQFFQALNHAPVLGKGNYFAPKWAFRVWCSRRLCKQIVFPNMELVYRALKFLT